MLLHSQIIDDFLPEFDLWRRHADSADYAEVISPVDGVVYPGISNLFHLSSFFQCLLKNATGKYCSINHLFMRLSTEGSAPPHWAHHDASMGEYSLMVYLNRPEHCRGGTALLEHVSGPDPDETTWRDDTNRPERWREVSRCPMKSNRAFIFRAELWHAALPIGGFGSTAQDGRLVLTAFFT